MKTSQNDRKSHCRVCAKNCRHRPNCVKPANLCPAMNTERISVAMLMLLHMALRA